MTLPPGPRLPSAVQAAAFLRDPIGFLARCQARYGDCFTAQFPGVGRVVYVADPAEVKRIFTGAPELLHAGEANARFIEPVVGRFSLLTLDGAQHLRRRKMLLPPFHGEHVRSFEREFAEVAAREIDGWPLGRPFSMLAAMRRITLEVIVRAVLGVRDPVRLERFREAILRFDRITGAVLPLRPLHRDLGPLSPWGRFLAAREALDGLVHAEIAGRRAGAGADGDVLSMLLAARDEDGRPLSDQEVRDELIGLLAAGYETSSTSLAWVFERVLRHPHVLARLTDAPDDAYVDAVIRETLRVRSPVTDSTRLLAEPAEVAGHRLPAGSQVIVALPLLHLRADAYPDPHIFRPERFLERDAEPYTFIPFGGGVRRCIGASFAQVEMKVVLRTVLERARLRPASPRSERQRLHHVTVVPARGSRVVVTSRAGSTPAVTLLWFPQSNPSQAVRLMLEHKGIEYERRDLVPGLHPLQVRAAGFRGPTVPALRVGERRVQGSLAISRALEELRPDPPLFPRDPDRRAAVEEAERWGEQQLQPVSGRIFHRALADDVELRRWLASAAGFPLPALAGRLIAPGARLFARDAPARAVRADLAALPALLDRVEELMREGVIGGPEPNAADFQIATTVRELMSFAALAPLVEGRPAGELARRVLPDWDESPVRLPPAWLPAPPPPAAAAPGGDRAAAGSR